MLFSKKVVKRLALNRFSWFNLKCRVNVVSGFTLKIS